MVWIVHSRCFTGLFQSGWSLFFFYWAVQLLHGKSPMGFGLFKDATDQWLELFTEDLCALFQGGWSFCYWQEKPKEFGVYKRCHWPVVLVVDRIFSCLVPGQLISYLLPLTSGLRCRQNIFVLCSRAANQLSSTLAQWFEVLTEHFCGLFQGGYSAVLYLESPEGLRRVKRKFNFNAEPPWDPS